MDYQYRLRELVQNEQESDQDFELKAKYEKVLESLDNCIKHIDNFKDDLPYDVYFIENSQFHTYFDKLKRIAIINDLTINKEELSNYIIFIKNIVNEEYHKLLNKLDYYKEIETAILDDNKPLLIEFLTCSFNNKHIDNGEYLNLWSEVMKHEPIKEELSNEVIIEENPEDITFALSDVFKQYGYNINSIEIKELKKLLKYAKIENVQAVLSFLKENNLTQNNFQERIKIITDLIIFYDKHSLDKIKEFIEQNNCSLNTLLGIGTIFFSRDIKFKFKKHMPDGTIVEKDAPKVVPRGNFDSFIYIIELIKKDLGYSSEQPISDNDLLNKNILFTISKDNIAKNLVILRLYGIIKGNKLPKSISSLKTNNTEYLIDRYIESGLYNYLITKQPTLTPDDNEEFRWFKLKRAMQLGDNVFATRGIKQCYMNDDELYGISKSSDGIKQNIMSDELLLKGAEQMLISLDEHPTRLTLFNQYFNCQIVLPSNIFKYIVDGEQYPSKGIEIENAFNDDYQVNLDDTYEEVYNDPFFNFLDNLKIKIVDGVYNPIKKNDYEYSFSFVGKDGKANVDFIISRQKVVRLIALLKKKNLWIDNDTPDIIKINTLLSILLKDTVITKNEYLCIRGYIKNAVLYLGGKQK